MSPFEQRAQKIRADAERSMRADGKSDEEISDVFEHADISRVIAGLLLEAITSAIKVLADEAKLPSEDRQWFATKVALEVLPTVSMGLASKLSSPEVARDAIKKAFDVVFSEGIMSTMREQARHDEKEADNA